MKERGSAEQAEIIAKRLDEADPEAAAMVRNLWVALESRTVISEAVGILRERYGLDTGRAFEVLARISGQEQMKLRAVAERVTRGEDLESIYPPRSSAS